MARIHISILAFLLSSAGLVQAQKADATLDRNEIRIGEQAILKLSVSVDKNNIPEIVFPPIGENIVEGLEVIKESGIDTLSTGDNVGSTRIETQIHFTSFDSGSYDIPALTIKVNGIDQVTTPLEFEVYTVEVDTTGGIFGNRGNLEVTPSFWDYVKFYLDRPVVKIGAAILVALLLIWFLVRWWLKNRKPKEVVEVIPEIPPHELALAELQRMLTEKKYLEKNVKLFHSELTDILRTFLEGAFGVHAHELTSTQILNAVRYSELDQKSIQSLRKILFRADMVKFAKEHPDSIENEMAVKDAIAFVENNIPQPPTEPTKPVEND
jgi:hypothetical protein